MKKKMTHSYLTLFTRTPLSATSIGKNVLIMILKARSYQAKAKEKSKIVLDVYRLRDFFL